MNINEKMLNVMIKNEKKYNNDSILDYLTDKITDEMSYEIEISKNNNLINHADVFVSIYNKFDIRINNVVIILLLSNKELRHLEKKLYELYQQYQQYLLQPYNNTHNYNESINIYLGLFDVTLRKMLILTFILNTRWFLDNYNYNNEMIEPIWKFFFNKLVLFNVNLTDDSQIESNSKILEYFNTLIMSIEQIIFFKFPPTSYRMILSHMNNLYKFRPGPTELNDPFSGPLPLDDRFYGFITSLINGAINNPVLINEERLHFFDQKEQDKRKQDLNDQQTDKAIQNKAKIAEKKKERSKINVFTKKLSREKPTKGGLKKTNKRNNKQKRNKNKTYKKRNKFSRKPNTNI